jgi:small-conductance mechanosensitive channel/CRP-like cAMP-binding protein
VSDASSLPAWLAALAAALGVVLALEVPFLLLRRHLQALRLRLLYHLWVASIGAVAGLVYGRFLGSAWDERLPNVWRGAAALAIVSTALVLYALFSLLVLQQPRGPQKQAAVPKLVRDVLGWVVFAAAVMLALSTLEITQLTAVLVSSTVLSAVVGLALQDVLKNLFAGMALQTERPFAIGDWLLVDGQPMQVVEMSWRSTHLRNSDGHDLFEPNAQVVAGRVVNLGSGARPIGWTFHVGLDYDVPPAQARAALAAAVAGAEGVAEQPAPGIFLDSFGDSAVNYRLRVWTRDVHQLTRFTDAVYGRIWYQLRRAGLGIPYPHRQLEIRQAGEEAAQRLRIDADRRRARIDALPLFRDLPEAARARLASAAVRVHFDHGERLVREGEAGDTLFIVDRGRVTVSKSGSAVGTTSLSLAMLGEGDFFGEMSLLTGEPRSATVASDGGCEVLALERAAMAEVLESDPTIAEALSVALAARVAATVARFEDRRERAQATAESTDSLSLLKRIRSFFKLKS